MESLTKSSRFYLILAFPPFLYFRSAIVMSLTHNHRPRADEGMFASPAFDLAPKDIFGTTF
jgi:hypothetical protein